MDGVICACTMLTSGVVSGVSRVGDGGYMKVNTWKKAVDWTGNLPTGTT